MIFITGCSFIIPNKIKEICEQPLLQIPTSNNITKIISYFILQKQIAGSYFFLYPTDGFILLSDFLIPQ